MSKVAAAPRQDAGKTESPDELLDRYLETTSYYRQTLLSINTAISSVWRKQMIANGAYETKDKLKSFWTNIGLVSALLIGVSYTSALDPVSHHHEPMHGPMCMHPRTLMLGSGRDSCSA